MAGRRTNLALLWLSILALISGLSAFLVGTPGGSWVVIAHGVIALSLLVLVPWKSVVAARGMRRPRPGRVWSLALTTTILATLGTGVLLVWGVIHTVGPFSLMQLHVSSGLLAASLTLIHTLQRPVTHRASDLSRRNAINAGGILAAAGGLWLLGEGALDLMSAPGGARRFTGSHEIADPSSVPFTQWINDSVQHLDPVAHRVVVIGMECSARELETVGDMVTATLDCTGGWYTSQEFSGVRLDRLIPVSAGRSILVRSVTGYWRRFPIGHANRLYLAVRMAGAPLRDGNGGPVRLVAPGRRGYWWVKWVDVVEVDDRPPWWQPPLPVA